MERTHTRALVLDGEGRERGGAQGKAGLVDPHRPHMGLSALRAIVRAEDGRDPPTALDGAVLEDEGSLRDLLIPALEAEGLDVLTSTVVPARGAARLALSLL